MKTVILRHTVSWVLLLSLILLMTAFSAVDTAALGSDIPLQITTPSVLPVGEVSLAYSEILEATGGTSPYTWALESGTLPSGLTLSTVGVISGIPTTASGPMPTEVFIKVTDSTSTPASASKRLSINIQPALAITTSSPFATGQAGIEYSQTVSATGGVLPYTWSLPSGTLPDGLSMDADGVISGTPTTVGGPTLFTVMVTDSLGVTRTRDLTITIITGPVTVSVMAPSDVTDGSEFIARVNASQLVGFNSYQFDVTYDPDILQVIGGEGSAEGVTSGLVGATVIPLDMWAYIPQGEPGTIRLLGRIPGNSIAIGSGYLAEIHFQVLSAPGQSAISLSNGNLWDKNGILMSPAVWLPATVNTVSSPEITSEPTLPQGEVNIAYSQVLEISGGQPPYTWSIESGNLPAGLDLDAGTGEIAGTPTAVAELAMITVSVTDNLSGTDTQNFSITISDAPVIDTDSPLPTGEAGQPYSQTLTVSGGISPYNWSIESGTLPAGLSFNETTGTISGTPIAGGGPYTITFGVTDNLGGSADKELLLTIVAAPSITTTSMPNGEFGIEYSDTLTLSGGKAPFTWSILSGALPPGLSLSSSGVISGTPTASGGPFNFTVRVTDGLGGTATQALSLTIETGPSIAIDAEPDSLNAPWTLTGPDGYTTSGNGDTALIDLYPGSYTLTWDEIEDWTSPSTNPETQELPVSGSILFTGVYTQTPGIITINAEPDSLNAPWTLTGPGGYTQGGNGDIVLTNLSVGDYTITWSGVEGWRSPSANPETKKLPNGGSIQFDGVYSEIIPVDVSVSAPATVPPGGIFVVYVNIDEVTGLNSSQFDLTFDPALIQVSGAEGGGGVIGGLINGKAFPIGEWSFQPTPGTPSGTIKVLNHLSGTGSASGSGYLAQIQFNVLGTTGQNSELTLSEVHLFDSSSHEITPVILMHDSIRVNPDLEITTTSLPEAEVGYSYNATLTAIGGTAPYSFSATGLPSGLSLSNAGEITGNPIGSGEFVISITVTDSETPAGNRSKNLTLHIYPALEITTLLLPRSAVESGTLLPAIPGWNRGISYSANLACTGGKGPYIWSATGLPTGLSFSPAGAITGTPTVQGLFNITVTLRDSLLPASEVIKSFALRIYLYGDATGDQVINMGDVTKVDRMILELDPPTAGADANRSGNINMGDITKIERIILGLDPE